MNKKIAKIEKVLDIAIELLKTEGDFGVTMRKVASLAQMSLSNLQYYFKNKDELLKAMADRYFQQCLDQLKQQSALSNTKELEHFVRMQLTHVFDLSDMCRIFREYWAISTRNVAIENYLFNYYQTMAELVLSILKPLAKNNQNLQKATSVFIAFVEGYSISAKALPVDLDEITTTMVKVLSQLLTSE